MAPQPIDLTKPQYDQSNYIGRAKHFFKLTNPLNIFATNAQLNEAKNAVESYIKTKKLPQGMTEEKLWDMKYLYDSAFHPDTGEKMFILCRMAAQAPMNTIITAGMITFYKTNSQTIFWQWINQTFNAGVNYTNRSGKAPISRSRLVCSYICACSGALGTALYLNSKVKRMKPLYARLVPFAAVAAANCVNIPMMRSYELTHGATCYTKEGAYVGESRRAAFIGISLVTVSRIVMAMPAMILTPMMVNRLASRGFFCYYPRAEVPLQAGLVALCAAVATPLACALFNQRASIDVHAMEPELAEKLKKAFPKETVLYYNKGL